MIDGGYELAVRSQDISRMVEADFGAEQEAMGFRQSSDIFGWKFISFECDDIDSSRTRWRALDEHVGRYVIYDATHARHKTVATDGGVVVDG